MIDENAGVGAAPISPLMSMAEVAALFGRTTRTVRNWIKAGHLRPRRVGGAVFFLRAEVDELLGINGSDDVENG